MCTALYLAYCPYLLSKVNIFTISDVKDAWDQLKNKCENMAIEYEQQLEVANSGCFEDIEGKTVQNNLYMQDADVH